MVSADNLNEGGAVSLTFRGGNGNEYQSPSRRNRHPRREDNYIIVRFGNHGGGRRRSVELRVDME